MRARHLYRFAPALLPLIAPLSCGPGAPSPAAANAQPVASAKPAPKEVVPSPVEAPEGLALTAQVKSPRATSEALSKLIPGTRELELGRLLKDFTDDEALASLIDVDKPMDVAFLVRPTVNSPNHYDDGAYIGTAFALRDDADFGALSGKFDLVAGAEGTQYLVRAGRDGQWFQACAVAAALGPAKRRLVCSDDHERKHLDLLLPWLSRGAPNRPSADDVHVEVYAAPLKKKFDSDLRDGRDEIASGAAGSIKTDHSEIDRVLRRGAKAAIGEAFALVDDLDRGGLAVNFGAAGPELRIDASFIGQTSWIARALLAGADVTTPVPALFGRLPTERAALVGFVRATPQHDLLAQPLQSFTGELVEAAAADFKWPKGDRELALQAVRLLFPKSADTFVAFGRGDDVVAATAKGNAPAPKATPAKKGQEHEADERQARRVHQLKEGLARPTWSLAAVERPLADEVDRTKLLASFATKPALAATLKALGEDSTDVRITARALPAKELKELPKGSFGELYDVTATVYHMKDKKRGKELEKIHFTAEQLLVPDGAFTWTASGNNLAPGELVRRVQDAMAQRGAVASSMAGFAALTAGTPAFGLVIRFGALLREVTPPYHLRRIEGELAQTPDKGDSSITVRSSATRAGAGGKAELVVQLPRDLFAAVANFAKHPPRD